jgi:hypothetical protein
LTETVKNDKTYSLRSKQFFTLVYLCAAT